MEFPHIENLIAAATPQYGQMRERKVAPAEAPQPIAASQKAESATSGEPVVPTAVATSEAGRHLDARA